MRNESFSILSDFLTFSFNELLLGIVMWKIVRYMLVAKTKKKRKKVNGATEKFEIHWVKVLKKYHKTM